MTHRPLRLLAIGLVLVLAAACGSDGDGSPDGGPTSATPSAAELPFPEVPPATGERVSVEGLSLRAPASWTAKKKNVDLLGVEQGSASDDDGLSSVIISSSEGIDASDGDVDLWVQRALRGSTAFTDDAEVLKPPALDGVESYHIRQVTPEESEVHELGATIDRWVRQVSFAIVVSYSEDERAEIIKSVLNTVSYDPVRR